MRPHPFVNQPAAVPPASGGLLYYPAQHRGKFPSVRAALASIGCTGDAAESAIAQDALNASSRNFDASPGGIARRLQAAIYQKAKMDGIE